MIELVLSPVDAQTCKLHLAYRLSEKGNSNFVNLYNLLNYNSAYVCDKCKVKQNGVERACDQVLVLLRFVRTCTHRFKQLVNQRHFAQLQFNAVPSSCPWPCGANYGMCRPTSVSADCDWRVKNDVVLAPPFTRIYTLSQKTRTPGTFETQCIIV